MKKLTLLLIITTFLSCSEDADYFSEKLSIEENSLSKGINENDLKNPFYLKGNFNVWKTNNNEIVVYSKTPDDISHFFILQTDFDDSKETISLPSKIDDILFLDHSMVLSFGKNHYYFGVSKKEEKSILNSLSKNTDFITLNYGNGLVHSWFGKDSNVSKNINVNSLISSKNSVIDELLKASDLDRAVDEDDCNSGGEGSDQCDVSASGYGGTSASCTVSCREGYYACCTQVMYAVTCKCKKNVDTD